MVTTRKKPPEYPFAVLRMDPKMAGANVWIMCKEGFEDVASAKNTKEALAAFRRALENNPDLVLDAGSTFRVVSVRTTDLHVKKVTKPTVELPPSPWSLALRRPEKPGD